MLNQIKDHPLYRNSVFSLIALLLLSGAALVMPASPAAAQDTPFYSAEAFKRDRLHYLAHLENDSAAQTASALVDLILGTDEDAARAAGMELLRRAGIPLVSPDGPVVALPDDLVLEDAALYADLVGQMVAATRAGDYYTPDQLAELLAAFELTSEVLPPQALIAALGEWGKRSGAPLESQTAGAAVRALSAQRQQVLFDGVELRALRIDPLQTILVMAHLTATSRVNPDAALSAADSVPVRYNRRARFIHTNGYLAQGGETDPCLALKNTLEGNTVDEQGNVTTPGWNAGDKHGLTEGLRGELINQVTGKLPEEWANGGRISTVIDRGTKALNMLLLLMGAQLELSADKTSTHFKHTPGSTAEHVHLTATARFDSALAQKKLACYELAGLSVPPSGPLQGFKVRWNMDQPLSSNIQSGGQFLTTVSADSGKIQTCGTCGEETAADGTSTLELYPRTERIPEAGEELTGTAVVYASLDKADFPFKLSDFVGLKDGIAGAAGFAYTKLYDLAINAMTRAGLPARSLSIEVGYHGYDIYTVEGEANIWLFYINLPVTIDLYTCSGINGPWMGTAGMKEWDVTMFGDLAAAIAKQPLPHDFEALNTNVSFSISAGAGEGIYPFYINEFMTGELELNNQANYGYQKATGIVGETDITVGGTSLQAVCDAGLSCSVRYPIVRVAEDPRCGDRTNDYYFD